MKPVVLCRSPASLRRFAKHRRDGVWLVASDDPRVEHEARGQAWVAGVVQIEKSEPFYAVAAEVLCILQSVNECLASWVPPGLDPAPGVVTWVKNVEGGLTSQRIQDTLLLIRSYRALLRDTGATELCLVSDPAYLWEDRVCVAVAQTLGIPVVRLGARSPAIRIAAWRARLRPPAIAAYALATVFRFGGGITARPRAAALLEGVIVFQLASARRKHIENIRPLMARLQERGARVAALCWGVGERMSSRTARGELQADGLMAFELECWLSFVGLGRCLRQGMSIGSAILRRARAPGPWRKLSYENVPLAPLLAPSLWHFVFAELPWRLCYVEAFRRCCAEARPAAFKPWAGPESFEGKFALGHLRLAGAPLAFHYWLGAAMEWPYADGAGMLDLFLAKGPHEARLASREYDLAEGALAIVGQPRFAAAPVHGGRFPAGPPRQRLGLPQDGKLCVGYDPNGFLRGILSLREQTEITAALLRICRANPDIHLIVKPHPSYPIGHLRPMLSTGGAQVSILPRTAAVDDFLDVIDVLVTKFSTLILEAALRGCPSLSVLLDGEDRFKVYGDLPEIVRSIPELEALLGELAAQPGRRSAWTAVQKQKHADLLPLFYHQSESHPSELAATAVLNLLERCSKTAT